MQSQPTATRIDSIVVTFKLGTDAAAQQLVQNRCPGAAALPETSNDQRALKASPGNYHRCPASMFADRKSYLRNYALITIKTKLELQRVKWRCGDG
jgi:multidrug efflux pump subunit AcrB